ncbi:hypothetical protein QL285_020753 [Trifolium repens]|jgi:hypothetical protein|nr:hypothetical protein QL285_020753 [Trifolium repens]
MGQFFSIWMPKKLFLIEAAIPLTTVPPSSHHAWTPYEEDIFNGIVKKNNCFDEKGFFRYPDAKKLSYRSMKSIRKFRHKRMTELKLDEAENQFKKKWTAVELETLHDAIDKHGYKIKLIIKDSTYDSGLDEKSIKQIEKRFRKLALEALQNRNGAKNSFPVEENLGLTLPLLMLT